MKGALREQIDSTRFINVEMMSSSNMLREEVLLKANKIAFSKSN